MKSIAHLIIISISMQLGTLFADKPITWIGSEHLSIEGGWKEHRSDFEPAVGGTAAKVDFPNGIWSAVGREIEVDAGQIETMTLSARARLTTEPAELKHTALTVRFLSGPGQWMEERLPARLMPKQGWQELSVTGKVPAEATIIWVGFTSHGGGLIELEEFELVSESLTLSSAALQGIRMADRIVPGSPMVLEPEADHAKVALLPGIDFSMDAAVWEELPLIEIPARRGKATGQSDHAASFQIGSDGSSLFVRFLARDSKLNFESSFVHERDAFEFFLMPTGDEAREGGGLRHEHMMVSMMNGKTDTDVRSGELQDAMAREIEGGWEAWMEIPLQNRTRKITPFNGLKLTFNVAYQDANTRPQESWFSFSSKDADSQSWRGSELYVPLSFLSESDLPYGPVVVVGESSFDVTPKHRGHFNLVADASSWQNFAHWKPVPEVSMTEEQEADGSVFLRATFPEEDGVPLHEFILLSSAFPVMAGETIEVSYEARSDLPQPNRLDRMIILTQHNWKHYGAQVDRSPMTGDWKRYIHTIEIPEVVQRINRNGRLMMNFAKPRGGSMDLRNLVVTRRVPQLIDAKIEAAELFNHWWEGEEHGLRFHLATLGPQNETVRVSAEIKDFLSGEVLASQEWDAVTFKGEHSVYWASPELPLGFFDVELTVADVQGVPLAQRSLRVSKSERRSIDRLSEYSGLWYHDLHSTNPPFDWDAHMDLLNGVGIGMVHFNHPYFKDSYGQFEPRHTREVFRLFDDRDFFIGSSFRQRMPKSGKTWRTVDEARAHVTPILQGLSGMVDKWNFANEPDLPGGWDPAPDAREWASFYRMFFNAVRQHSPSSEVVSGSFNRIPVDYIRDAHELNGDLFSDPYIGVHLYGVNTEGGSFDEMLENRRELDELFPGWQVWDNESGIVFTDHLTLLDLQSKKLPLVLNVGIENSFFYNDRDIIFPLGDSNPLLPMEAFRNDFLHGAEPKGRVVTDDGSVHVYLFEDAQGDGKAALWRARKSEVAAELPVSDGGAIAYDLFGNVIDSYKGERTDLTLLTDRIHYLEGIDLDACFGMAGFEPAFEPSPLQEPPDMLTELYIVPHPARGQFDHRLSPGGTGEIYLKIYNDSEQTETIELSASKLPGLDVEFEPSRVRLKSAESQVVTARFVDAGLQEAVTLELSGSNRSGDVLVPLKFGIQPAPALEVTGHTRTLQVTNNGQTPRDFSVLMSRHNHSFQPSMVQVTALEPNETRVFPVSINPVSGRMEERVFMNNAWSTYDMKVDAQGEITEMEGNKFILTVDPDDSPVTAQSELPHSILPRKPSAEDFRAELGLFIEGDFLRIQARVYDSSPYQTKSLGQLKEGGDALIIAIDSGEPQTGPDYGEGDFECGFALYNGEPTSYRWNGTFGLESARSFDEAVQSVSYQDGAYFYDVRLPLEDLFPEGQTQAGLSMAFFNGSENGRFELIECGGGIYPQRDATQFGAVVIIEK